MPAKEKKNKRVEFPSGLTVKEKSSRKGCETITRTYKLITPMFGGGFEAANYDPITPIRASSIKGQLRFWWRATRSGQFKSIKDLKKAEDWLWGTAAADDTKIGESRIKIDIEIIDLGEVLETTAWWEWTVNREGRGRWSWKDQLFGSKTPGYAAFPIRPPEDKDSKPRQNGFRDKEKRAERTTTYALFNTQFKIFVRYPAKFSDDIEAALWAWETFGGIGARTRRGFGAIAKLNKDLNFAKLSLAINNKEEIFNGDTIDEYIFMGLNKYVSQGKGIDNVPKLPRPKTKYTETIKILLKRDVDQAWKHLIKSLEKFRQSRSGNFGRSYWPEPDLIRETTNMYSPLHEPWDRFEPVDAYPRAYFGLPINFHFKNGADSNRERRLENGDLDTDTYVNSEPWDTILRPEKLERLASPLVLRPHVIVNQGVAIAIILENTGVEYLPQGLVLASPFPDPSEPEDKIRWDAAFAITTTDAQEITPLKTKKYQTDPLKAFLETL